jgi:hypothetical protein
LYLLDEVGEHGPLNTLLFDQVNKKLIIEQCVNHLIPWAESVQLCGRKRTHPFREEKPYFGLVSASREMWKKRTRVKNTLRIVQILPMEY